MNNVGRKKAILVVVIIIPVASHRDGHAEWEMVSRSSPLLKPFRGLHASYYDHCLHFDGHHLQRQGDLY